MAMFSTYHSAIHSLGQFGQHRRDDMLRKVAMAIMALSVGGCFILTSPSASAQVGQQQQQGKTQAQPRGGGKAVAPRGGGATHAVTPRATRTVTPRATRTVTPRATRTVTPRATRTVTPRATRTVTPKATRTVIPRATRTVTPRATRTVTPQGDPHGYPACDPHGHTTWNARCDRGKLRGVEPGRNSVAIIIRCGAADTACVMAAAGGRLSRSAPWARS